MSLLEVAKAGWDKYREFVVQINPQVRQMPTWEQLVPEEQRMWREVAFAMLLADSPSPPKKEVLSLEEGQ